MFNNWVIIISNNNNFYTLYQTTIQRPSILTVNCYEIY